MRQTAAWIMGQDHTYAPFHEALLKLIADPQPMVRRNAALALSNFGDPARARNCCAMLRPYTIVSPTAGAVHYRLKLGEYVNPGTLVAHVGGMEVRSPLPGDVRELSAAGRRHGARGRSAGRDLRGQRARLGVPARAVDCRHAGRP